MICGHLLLSNLYGHAKNVCSTCGIEFREFIVNEGESYPDVFYNH